MEKAIIEQIRELIVRTNLSEGLKLFQKEAENLYRGEQDPLKLRFQVGSLRIRLVHLSQEWMNGILEKDEFHSLLFNITKRALQLLDMVEKEGAINSQEETCDKKAALLEFANHFRRLRGFDIEDELWLELKEKLEIVEAKKVVPFLEEELITDLQLLLNKDKFSLRDHYIGNLPLKIKVTPGSASQEDINDVLEDISNLYKLLGGSGIKFEKYSSTTEPKGGEK